MMKPLMMGAATWCRWVCTYQTSRHFCCRLAQSYPPVTMITMVTGKITAIARATRHTGMIPLHRNTTVPNARTLTLSTIWFEEDKVDHKIIEKKPKDIILLGTTGEDLGIMSKNEAKALALENNCTLLLVKKKHKGNSSYQMYTEKQIRIMEQRKLKVKTLKLSSKIGDHELAIKSKHAVQWLHKGLRVKVHVKNDKPKEKEAMPRIMKFVCAEAASLCTVEESKRTEYELVCNLRPIETADKANRITPLKHEDLAKDKLKKTTTSEEPET